jgi:hypothetical protein
MVKRDTRRQLGVQGPLSSREGFQGDTYIMIARGLIAGQSARVAADVRKVRRKLG